MDIQAEKLQLIEELARIQDAQIIKQIKQLLKKAYNPIAGYNSNGQSITQRDFIQQLEQAEKEYKSGNYQTIDEVEKESETW
jgi:ribulose bisphosphate carboxylase small subunit